MTSHRTTDASYFSPLAGQHTPQRLIPPCAECGEPSLGALRTEDLQTYEFHCGKCRDPKTFAVMSDRLWPVWRIMSYETPSRLRLQKLPREAQEKRVIEK